MPASLQTVSGSYLYERWKISATHFISLLLDEHLQGGLRVYNVFDCPITTEKIEQMAERVNRSSAQIDVLKRSLEKARRTFPLELKWERVGEWTERLQREQDIHAQLITEVESQLKYWRYPVEDTRALERKYPNLVPSELGEKEQKPANKEAHHLKKATNALKIVQSSKWLSEHRAFEVFYNASKKKDPPPTDASIIRAAKKKWPKMGSISDSTIRKWIKKP